MSVEHYNGNTKLNVDAKVLTEFEQGVKTLKDTMLSYGFAPEAVDAFNVTLNEYTLTISDEDRRSGAFHVYADGNPFYEMTISVPGSLLEMSDNAQNSPLNATPRQQGLLLFFEVSLNLINRVGDVLQQVRGIDKSLIHGGASMPVAKAENNTSFRCKPADFLDGLNYLLNYRLGMLLPEKVAEATVRQRQAQLTPKI